MIEDAGDGVDDTGARSGTLSPMLLLCSLFFLSIFFFFFGSRSKGWGRLGVLVVSTVVIWL